MSRFDIFKGDRPFKTLGYDIWKHYWMTMDRWNEHLKVNIKKDPDKGTPEYKALNDVFEFLCHLSDIIDQTGREYRAEIWKLKCKLRKWESNRGRKPSLSEEQKERVRQLRADGRSLRSLGREFGVSASTIGRAIKTLPTKDSPETPKK